METKLINLSISELGRIERRVRKLIAQGNGRMSGLERAADNCWEYPGADEAYENYSNEMVELEGVLNRLEEAKENIERTIAILNKLQ